MIDDKNKLEQITAGGAEQPSLANADGNTKEKGPNETSHRFWDAVCELAVYELVNERFRRGNEHPCMMPEIGQVEREIARYGRPLSSYERMQRDCCKRFDDD